jgi:hypothetical protein
MLSKNEDHKKLKFKITLNFKHFCKKPLPTKLLSANNIYIFPGSSVVEQVAVNHLVGGSNPSRGAIFLKILFQDTFFQTYDYHSLSLLQTVATLVVLLVKTARKHRHTCFLKKFTVAHKVSLLKYF